ncbi:iron complex outermembrane receptor protein [Massilia aurea]|uniref:Iron complex outermembrane receptor protein n=1 Tax=Massilia aurea TaxID=373040 RepID=A0A7W9WZJ4_9BURK|nr:TonB-dependent receptor [Massilia aurea]MBB6133714.1 iron complex outermembrane receptor protein [Massilia aurea]
MNTNLKAGARAVRGVLLACAGTTIALASLPLAAQTLPAVSAAELPRVEVTGSAIRRVQSETALPVQTISRAEIEKTGVTTAAELMGRVSANSNGLTDGASINVGGDQRGFNSANLRGIGTSSTLVLLNGRRMANFASPGDDSGVDLNNIPAAALERVEVLLDGASALYGTDAIGGVINFITRKDFQGLEANVYVGTTDEGGAGKRTASLSAGKGVLERDGYNIFAVADFQRTNPLNTSQRSFIPGLQVEQRLGHLLSSYTSPANIRLTSAQRDHLQEIGFTLNGKPITNRLINLSVPGCAPPANVYLPDGTGGVDACTYNYMGDTELYPKSEKASVLSRAVIKLGGSHQAYAEVALSRAKTDYTGSSARVAGYVDYSRVPQLAGTGLDGLDDDIPGELELRMRLNEAGQRTSTLTSEGVRFVVGVTGTVGGWDYDTAYNHSVNTVKDRDTHGYLLYNELLEGIADGRINPFGPSSPEGRALIDSIQVDDVVRRARGTLDAVDVKLSRALMPMAGGDLAVAIGGEARREKNQFTPSALLLSDNINNDAAPEGGRATSDSRDVAAVYGEVLVPFAKQWEAQLSARYDLYENVGGATSPKIGLTYRPSDALLLRGSAGRGFRAPSMTELYRPTVYSSTATLPDPVYCATVENNYSDCADNWDTRRYSNDALKPERSRQFSLGAVFAAGKHVSASLDYWNIKRTNLISEIGDDIILGNLAKYGDLVYRDEDGLIDYIELRKDNRGAQLARGLDLALTVRGVDTAIGRFGGRLNGTYVLTSKIQNAPGDAFVSNLNRFVTDGVVQRWRHTVSVDWDRGPLSASLQNTFSSGYEDQNTAINIDNGSVVAANRVKRYSLWDLSGAYAVNTNLKLRVGIQNLFDTSPPYSNQAYYFLSGYDPSYTDPRGRRFYASANYSFK